MMARPPTPKEFYDSYQEAHSRKSSWDMSYRSVMAYCMPEGLRSPMEVAGAMKDYTYVSVPRQKVEQFAGTMLMNLTPHDMPWVQLDVVGGSGREDLEPEHREQIAKIERIVRDAVEESNFATQAPAAYKDLAAGTMCMKVMKSDRPGELLRFTNIPLLDLYLQEGSHSEPRTVYWRREINLGLAEKIYGRKALSKHFDEDVGQDENDTRKKTIELVEGCVEMLAAPGEQAWSHRFFTCVLDVDGKVFLETGAENVMPFVVTRWATVANEIYGRGPAWIALPDMKTLNSLVSQIMTFTDQQLNPVIMVQDDGRINVQTLSLEPGTLVPVMATNPAHGPPIQPLVTPGHHALAEMDKRELVASINESMLVEDHVPLEGGTKSREEVMVRHQAFQRRLGAVYPRLLREWLVPLVRRIIDVLNSSGSFDMPEGSMINPVELAYKPGKAVGERQATTAAIERYVALMNGVTQNPAIAATLQVDKFPAFVADNVGLPHEMIKNPEEMQSMGQEMQGMGEQMMGGPGSPSLPLPPASQG